MSLTSLINNNLNSITIDNIENNSSSSISSIKSCSNESNELQMKMNHALYLFNSLFKDQLDAIPEAEQYIQPWEVEGYSFPNCQVSPVMPINIEKTDNDNDCKNSNIIDCDDDNSISTLSNSTALSKKSKLIKLYKKILDINDSYDEACDYIRKLIRNEKIQDLQDSQQRDKITEKVTRFYRIFVYTVDLENMCHVSDLRRGLSAMEEMVRLYFEVKEIVNDNGIIIQIDKEGDSSSSSSSSSSSTSTSNSNSNSSSSSNSSSNNNNNSNNSNNCNNE